MAARIAALESLSSWSPQPNFQPLPPMAHAPTPSAVISMSLFPNRFVSLIFLVDAKLPHNCAPSAVLSEDAVLSHDLLLKLIEIRNTAARCAKSIREFALLAR